MAREIGLHGQRLSAGGDDALDHLGRGFFPLTIVNGDAETCASQSLRDGSADNPRGARHQARSFRSQSDLQPVFLPYARSIATA